MIAPRLSCIRIEFCAILFYHTGRSALRVAIAGIDRSRDETHMQTFLQTTTLSTTHLWFNLRTSTTLEIDAASGSALRGSFFNAIWSRFCTNKQAPSCTACPLHTLCPVSALVSPLREENERGQDIPRPYVMVPPLEGARRY